MIALLRSLSCRGVTSLRIYNMNTSAQKQFIERLHNSSASGQVQDVQSLLKGGVDVNCRNDRGWTALMLAARNGHSDVVKLLLDNGADPSAFNSIGQTAAEIAQFWNHEKVVHLFNGGDTTGVSASLREQVRNFFCHNPLDYASENRADKSWISSRLEDPSTVFIVFAHLKPLVLNSKADGRNRAELCLLKNGDIMHLMDKSPATVFLGNESINTDDPTTDEKSTENFRSWFVIDVSFLSDSDVVKLREGSYLTNPFPGFLQLSKTEAAISAQARTLLDWHQRYRFCPTCGSTMTIKDGGHKKECVNSDCDSRKGISNVSYPRTDPSVIMLVVSPDGQNCLLGRQKRFPAGMWSCLAGFMEPGESIEDCCRREVKEESDVNVGHVEYHSSQPWPFPCSLMIGCLAYATSEKITEQVDKEELEDARWFSRQQVSLMLTHQHSDGLFVPPQQAIAHQLIKAWLKRTSNL